MRTLCVILLLGVATLGRTGEEKVLYNADSVTVSAEMINERDAHYAEYRVRVMKRGRCFYFSSDHMGDTDKRMQDLSAVEAKQNYLSVPASCGSGNASKCRGYQVFATDAALRHLGYLTGRWDGGKVVVYEAPWFYDTGDQLEGNELLSHAESPRYSVAYREKNGLRFDAAKTWDLNAAAYAARRSRCAGTLLSRRLAKLCGRQRELKAAEQAARKSLPPQS